MIQPRKTQSQRRSHSEVPGTELPPSWGVGQHSAPCRGLPLCGREAGSRPFSSCRASSTQSSKQCLVPHFSAGPLRGRACFFFSFGPIPHWLHYRNSAVRTQVGWRQSHQTELWERLGTWGPHATQPVGILTRILLSPGRERTLQQRDLKPLYVVRDLLSSSK